MERCCFLLPTRNREVCLLLLETVQLSCEALQERENALLPLLHKLWKPLMLRVKDQDCVVRERSLVVLCEAVIAGRDFLRKRWVEWVSYIKVWLPQEKVCGVTQLYQGMTSLWRGECSESVISRYDFLRKRECSESVISRYDFLVERWV